QRRAFVVSPRPQPGGRAARRRRWSAVGGCGGGTREQLDSGGKAGGGGERGRLAGRGGLDGNGGGGSRDGARGAGPVGRRGGGQREGVGRGGGVAAFGGLSDGAVRISRLHADLWKFWRPVCDAFGRQLGLPDQCAGEIHAALRSRSAQCGQLFSDGWCICE